MTVVIVIVTKTSLIEIADPSMSTVTWSMTAHWLKRVEPSSTTCGYVKES